MAQFPLYKMMAGAYSPDTASQGFLTLAVSFPTSLPCAHGLAQCRGSA